MRVPSYDSLSPIYLSGSVFSEKRFACSYGGYEFSISPSGRMGSSVYTTLPDGSELAVHFRLVEGPRFRLVGSLSRKSSFGLMLTPPGKTEYSDKAELAVGLTDTAELTGDLVNLRPIVAAAFGAIMAAAPGIKKADESKEAAEAAAKAAKLDAANTKLRADLSDIAALDLPGRQVKLMDPRVEYNAGLNDDERYFKDGTISYSVYNWHSREDGSYGENVRAMTHGGDTSAWHDAYLWIYGPDEKGGRRRNIDAKRKHAVPWAMASVGSIEAEFESTSEIADPLLRNLAVLMMGAWETIGAKMLVKVTAVEDAKNAKAQEAAAAAAASLRSLPAAASAGTRAVASTGASNYGRSTVVLPGKPGQRDLQFHRLSDGTWGSDAIVAVRRGKAGEKVYAEAVHVPRGTLPAKVVVAPANLRPLFDLPPTILGWIGQRDNPSQCVLAWTCDPSLCDADYVSDPTAQPPESMALPHPGFSAAGKSIQTGEKPFRAGGKVEVTVGPDAGRRATVVAGYDKVYGGKATDGARVKFDDSKPTKSPLRQGGLVQAGDVRDYAFGCLDHVGSD